VRAVPETPIIAIGGVTAANAGELIGAGAAGVAVVGAVANAADPLRATGELLKALG
jgi:thiamine-phosphate pyrophosphorylase